MSAGKIVYAFELIKRLVDGKAEITSVVRNCVEGPPSDNPSCNGGKRYS